MFGMKWERILEDRTFFSKAIQSPMVAWQRFVAPSKSFTGHFALW